MFKTLLIATDGSMHANSALQVCAAIAVRFQSRVILVHVLMRDASFDAIHRAFQDQGLSTDSLDELVTDTISSAAIGLPGPPAPIVPLLQLGTLAQRIIDRARRTLLDAGLKDIECITEDGNIAKTILDVAAREGADTIILGHRGLGAFQGAFMGSVSAKVTHLAECTVIAVK